MVVLSFQVVQLTPHHPQPVSLRRGGARTNIIRCVIAEPSGEPAPFGEKTRYNDGVFARVFMTLFARKMEKFAKPVRKGEENKKKEGLYDYESFVEVEINGVKQKSGVHIKKCRYLENSGCVGMCVNMCKTPTTTKHQCVS
uniref:Beta-carotene isomerase D27-like C-terminal domain-containing protein n=1 Tax=Lotus japonicus TaxID=34305 RepID=I3SAL6_LOTJA|nr:unknown [Lotus japonicus]